MKRFVVMAALAALVVPTGAHASVSYSAPFLAGPQGGDQYNTVMADPATGDMTVLRVNPAGLSGGLGCGGQGGYANFIVNHDAAEPVTKVSVAYSDALVDPYSWIVVNVRQGDLYLYSEVRQGIQLQEGTLTVTLPEAATGSLTVWFGLQVASACPNVDGATATFDSVTFTS